LTSFSQKPYNKAAGTSADSTALPVYRSLENIQLIPLRGEL
jgi:hypothetical protein